MEKSVLEKDNSQRKTDEMYMRRCLQLAENGRENTAPNPMVGAVIVCDGKIIGEGYHVRCGEGHAEVNAIASVKDPSLFSKSTIYVSLEPCSHYGKTPPCADLIISKHIPRVVVGCGDPFAKVAGRGIQKLRDAGIDVTVGVLEEECKALNCRFMTFQTHKRPYITLKWAESADGFIDSNRPATEEPLRLSTPFTRMLVHKHRAENQAILVGRKTAQLDNPSLTVRDWYGKNPLRLIIDPDCTLSSHLHLFDGSVPTVVFSDVDKLLSKAMDKAALKNVTFVGGDIRRNALQCIFDYLYKNNVQSLLVEGGANTLHYFIADGKWDECFREVTSTAIGDGIAAPQLTNADLVDVQKADGHFLFHYRRRN